MVSVRSWYGWLYIAPVSIGTPVQRYQRLYRNQILSMIASTPIAALIELGSISASLNIVYTSNEQGLFGKVDFNKENLTV